MRNMRFLVMAVLLSSGLATQAGTIFGLGSTWKYFIGTVPASDPDPTAWRQAEFIDTTWLSGNLAVGYGAIETAGPILTTVVPSNTPGTNWTSIYFRKTFTLTAEDVASIASVDLRVLIDDGAVAWINNIEVGRVNVGPGELDFNATASVADETRDVTYSALNINGLLKVGLNVVTVHGFNGNLTSSDFGLNCSLSTVVDTILPTATTIDPAPGNFVATLTAVNIIFSEAVTGVEATDFLINGVAATSVVTNNANDYTFLFTQPPLGTVNVEWVQGHGITDVSVAHNAFEGGAWNYILDPEAASRPVFRITEFLAGNTAGIRDENGEQEDWIEIKNAGAGFNLAGYYLTDVAGSNMWRFPSVMLNQNQYIVVWASGEPGAGKTNNPAYLHTNFRLTKGNASGGEYLALLDPQGNVVSEFAPRYPEQFDDRSYGRDEINPSIVGYFDTPTPGRPNVGSGSGFAPTPVFSIEGGFYTNTSLSLTLSAPSGSIRYTTDGTNPTAASTEYTGTPIVINNSTTVRARVFQAPLLPSAVVVHTYQLAGVGTANFSSTLPIIIINTHGQQVASDLPSGSTNRTRASIVVIDTFRGRARITDKPQLVGSIQMEIRGQTSAGGEFLKKGFNIEFNDPYGNDLDVDFLGLPEDSDFALTNPYSDKPFLQNFLAHELYEKMGHYAVRRRFAEVFLDTTANSKLDFTGSNSGDYQGIYLILEKIKVNNVRVDIAELGQGNNTPPELTGGYIFKKDKVSPDEPTWDTVGGTGFGSQNLRHHEPKPRFITQSQSNYLRNYLVAMEGAMYANDWLIRTGTNHYTAYLEPDSFVESHWIVEFSKQIDGYRLSSYFTKERGARVQAAPIWDWNLSFGNADYLEGGRTNGWYYTQLSDTDHIWSRRLISGSASGTGTTGDPDFKQKIVDRWAVLRTNLFKGDVVNARVDEMAAILNEPAQRDFARFPRLGTRVWPNPNGSAGGWSVDYVNPTTFAGVIGEMKKFIAGRYGWIESQFKLRAPQLSHAGGDVTPGTEVLITAPLGTIYYCTNGVDPRAPGGGIHANARIYTGPGPVIIGEKNVQLIARVFQNATTNNWNGVNWGPPAKATYVIQPPPLIISEIMYHPLPPPAGSTNSESDYEYIELKNISGGVLSLAGFKFTVGITFDFSTSAVTSLPVGGKVLLVRNHSVFASRYGGLSGIAGTYPTALANEGEQLVLMGPLGEVVHDFVYHDDWYPSTDGAGFSLVVADENQPRWAWGTQGGWRASAAVNGSPAADDPAAPNRPIVYINEVLAHTDLPNVDFVELYNPNPSASVNVGGWYLTDDYGVKKFRIPTDTMILPGGHISFDEHDFNVDPNNTNSFNLRSSGDEAYLMSADPVTGNLTGYFHGFGFGASLNGVSFGRYSNSVGAVHFVSQAATTRNQPNIPPGPKIGPVVISEIHYRPADVPANGAMWDNTEDEYVEILNISGGPVQLWDPNATTNTWRLRDAVSFRFPVNITIADGERILITSFSQTNAAAVNSFRSKFSVPQNVRMFGPFDGRLSNNGESVELIQPDLVRFYETNEVVTSVLIDRVEYVNITPWPVAADGIGPSLHRISATAYGNDPINWAAAPPTAGSGYTSGPPPIITQEPVSQIAVASTSTSFSVGVGGNGPFTYQWRVNGVNIPNATGPTLALNNVQPSQSGEYQVIVMNPANSVASSFAQLTVLVPAQITQQPQSQSIRPGQSVTFNVVAESTWPLSFQWRFNGNPIPGATAPSYNIPVVDRYDAGVYDCVITDIVTPVVSQAATLTVLIDPVILTFSTNLTVVQGANAILSVECDGSLPMSYRWRRRFTQVKLEHINSYTSFLVITNVQPNTTAATNPYSVVLTNVANAAPGIASSNIILTVLLDGDSDGMPNTWEDQHFPGTGASPDADADNDGMSNREEYIAGTDPNEEDSFLKIDEISAAEGIAISFMAISNRTYSIEYKDSLELLTWTKLTDVAAGQVNRIATVTDPTGTNKRFYKLRTPKL